ncbi:hypothetical protein T4B_7127 [Trichinella pseudospiralis]|uniref:Uncharacterized protein n=1 Tax=Trichinella pseudospiralis TaxID=6337 RepID=A0A0V1GHP0_TRIPS|nr:hypothetical protein T4B_7127 [Trichinella pseudospiralis]
MPCKVLSEIAMLWNKWPINFSALPALLAMIVAQWCGLSV